MTTFAERNGLDSFQVNLFKFLQRLSKAEADSFFQSFGASDGGEQYSSIRLLRLMGEGKVKPQSELLNLHLEMLNHGCRKYLDLATRPEPTKRTVHRGIGLVINQWKFEADAKQNRKGSEHDVKNLEVTLKGFGCRLIKEENLDEREIHEAINRFVYQVEDSPDLDYLVMVILR